MIMSMDRQTGKVKSVYTPSGWGWGGVGGGSGWDVVMGGKKNQYEY